MAGFWQGMRQALSSGAEIFPATLYSAGRAANYVTGWIAERWAGVNQFEVDELDDLASNMAEAGRKIGRMDKGERIELSEMPANQYLYGDNPQGRRYKIGVDIWQPDLGQYITVHVDAAGSLTPAELIAEAEKMAKSIRESYPEKFKPNPEIEMEDRPSKILWAERRF